MKTDVSLLCLALALTLPAVAQDGPSLGDVARASRANQAQLAKPAKVFTNEDSNPQAIKDGEDSLAVYQRAVSGFIHDTAHRCTQQAAGNSGPRPGWKQSEIYEVAAVDRMRLIGQEPSQIEWIMAGDAYYSKENGAAWHKVTDPGGIAMARLTFPGALIPNELKFGYKQGELKFVDNQVLEGTPVVHYRYASHIGNDADRTIDYWVGKQDSLPRRIDMWTETRYPTTPAIVWTESIKCTYGVEIKIEPPL